MYVARINSYLKVIFHVPVPLRIPSTAMVSHYSNVSCWVTLSCCFACDFHAGFCFSCLALGVRSYRLLIIGHATWNNKYFIAFCCAHKSLEIDTPIRLSRSVWVCAFVCVSWVFSKPKRGKSCHIDTLRISGSAAHILPFSFGCWPVGMQAPHFSPLTSLFPLSGTAYPFHFAAIYQLPLLTGFAHWFLCHEVGVGVFVWVEGLIEGFDMLA